MVRSGLVSVSRRNGVVFWHATLLPDVATTPSTASTRRMPHADDAKPYFHIRPAGKFPSRVTAHLADRVGEAEPSVAAPATMSSADDLVARIQAAGGTLTLTADGADRDLRRLDAQNGSGVPVDSP